MYLSNRTGAFIVSHSHNLPTCSGKLENYFSKIYATQVSDIKRYLFIQNKYTELKCLYSR